MARDCPNSPVGAGGDRGCFNCGQEGHRKIDCPEPMKERTRGPLICRNCQQPGHMAADCTAERVERIGEDGLPVPKASVYVPRVDEVTDMIADLRYTNANVARFDEYKVTVSDGAFAHPLQTFDEAGLCPTLMERIAALGYESPTAIQRFTIPVVLAGKDLIACSQTGSGKSAAFILPILQKLMNDDTVPDRASIAGQSTQYPLVVVVSPTRELGKQLHDHFRIMSEENPRRIGVAQAYGGTHVQSNRASIRCGTHVLCAVPGRLKQFVDEGTVSFEKVRYLVLDEADRMLDRDFGEAIQFFRSHSSMPPKDSRQTLMFSATFPPEVEQLARHMMRPNNTVKVVIGTLGGVNSDVEQSFVQAQGFPQKRELLLELLESYPSVKKDSDVAAAQRDRIIVFVEQKKIADMIGIFLNLKGFDATTMHGAREQQQREEALRTLKQGKFPVLVATAVAARGLDIKGVSLVVNFDLPKEIDDYVHRVGRTGRVGKAGKAISFYGPTDSPLAPALEQALRECGQAVPDFISSDASGTTDIFFEVGFSGFQTAP